MKMHLLLAFAFSWTQAHATSFFIHPFSQFTKNANLIIRGTTTQIHVENAVGINGEKTIFTYADLNIREVIKGDLTGSTIKIRRLGGTLDGITLAIPGSVEFEENEEGVFFLSEEREDRSYEVTGMELGKFYLEKSRGQEVLKGGLFAYSRKHEHEDGDDHAHQVGDLSENNRTWTLNQLKELVHQQGGTPSVQSNPATRSSVQTSQPEPVVDKNQVISDTNINQPTSSDLNSGQNQVPSSTNNAAQNSPLYFNSALWYSLAILFLVMGVYTILRRR